jgi:cytoskeletal protein RodZ
MNRVLRVLIALVLLGGLSLALLGGLLLLTPPSGAVAQVPPTKKPADTPTDEPPTEEPPTEEPPTEEPPTEEPPTEEPATEEPPTVEPPHRAEAPDNDKPNPNCQSTVSGNVIASDGAKAIGATVTLEGEGVSRSMMTDDDGRYGFGGLCPGTLSLVATLPGGGMVHAATIEVDGKNAYDVNLTAQKSGGGSTSEPAVAVPAQATEVSPTPEPSMPTTGYSGWLLLGGAAMGTLLLILAGARRTLSTSRVRSRD